MTMGGTIATGASTNGPVAFGSGIPSGPQIVNAIENGEWNAFSKFIRDPWSVTGTRGDVLPIQPYYKHMYPFLARTRDQRPPTQYELMNPQLYDPEGTPLLVPPPGSNYNIVNEKPINKWDWADYLDAGYVPSDTNSQVYKDFIVHMNAEGMTIDQFYQLPPGYNPKKNKFAGIDTTGWVFGTPPEGEGYIQVTGPTGGTGWWYQPGFATSIYGTDQNISYGPGGVPEPENVPDTGTAPIGTTKTTAPISTTKTTTPISTTKTTTPINTSVKTEKPIVQPTTTTAKSALKSQTQKIAL